MAKYKKEWVLVNGKYDKRPDASLYYFNEKMKAITKGYVSYSPSEKMYYAMGKKTELKWFKSPSEAKKWMLSSYGLGKIREITRSKLGGDYTKNKGKR